LLKSNQRKLILNQVQINSDAIKSNRKVVKSNNHRWFNHELNQITIWLAHHCTYGKTQTEQTATQW